MIRKPITIGISNGLEASPIAMLVQVASQYASSIYLESEARKVNAKSIMGMMSLGLDAGESVVKSRKMKEQEVFRHEDRKCVEKIHRYNRGISV